MKIIDKSERKRELFGNIKIGDVFKFNGLYIKISNCEAFSLETYKIQCFEGEIYVQSLESELIIKGEKQ